MASSHGLLCALMCSFSLDLDLDWSKLWGMADAPNKFRKQISEAWTDLLAWEKVRALADEQIEDLRALIKANANFLSNEERLAENMLLDVFKHPSDIPEAVKLTLVLAKARKERLTPLQIKEEAEKRGFDFSGYTNPMASIHTILRRMKESDPPEVDFDEATSTFASIRLPTDIPSSAFHDQIGKRVMARMLTMEQEKAMTIAGQEIESILESARKKLRAKQD